jgi:2-C-methyl-D-erythritol 4-phosphate cytidylyltransferase
MNRVLIFAGGTGQRMGASSVPKQFLCAYSKPIIVHTIEHFQKCNAIQSIVVVCLADYIDYLKGIISFYQLDKVVSVVSGGENGQESIFNGLKELVRLYGDNSDDIVLIHDGVRPLINEQVIIDNINCVKQYGNAITVCKAIETIVLLDDNSVVEKVMDRQYCNTAKAPQSFYLKDIYSNHLKAIQENKHDFIDSAMLMQYYGAYIHTVLGPNENIKITTPMDYYLFKAILDARENEQVKLL